MIIDEDFMFIDLIEADTAPIKLLTGPYKDVVYRYTTLSIKDNEDGSGTLSFSYELFQMGEHFETVLRKDDRFHNHIGLILNSLILEAIEHIDNTQQVE